MNDAIGRSLRRCGLFRGVDEAHLAQLAALALEQRFAKGEAIFQQGDPPPGIYVVTSGQVRVYKLNPAGKEHVLHIASPGATFAEIAAIGRFACPAHAQAIEQTACVLLPTDRLNRSLRNSHELCLQLMAGMAVWVRQFVGLVEDIVLRDAAGRVARFLLEGCPTEGEVVELPVLKRHLASHLNLSSETLSRTLRRLTEAGLIEEASPQRLRLVDRGALREVAEGLYPEV